MPTSQYITCESRDRSSPRPRIPLHFLFAEDVASTTRPRSNFFAGGSQHRGEQGAVYWVLTHHVLHVHACTASALACARAAHRAAPGRSLHAARTSLTHLSHATLPRISLTRLSHAPLSRASLTRLSHAPLPRASPTQLSHAPLAPAAQARPRSYPRCRRRR